MPAALSTGADHVGTTADARVTNDGDGDSSSTEADTELPRASVKTRVYAAVGRRDQPITCGGWGIRD